MHQLEEQSLCDLQGILCKTRKDVNVPHVNYDSAETLTVIPGRDEIKTTITAVKS